MPTHLTLSTLSSPLVAANTAMETSGSSTLEQAAREFESLFVNELLKSMREASQALTDEDGLFASGRDEQLFRSLFDSQIASDLTAQGGLGIADALLHQFNDSTTGAP